MTCCYCGTRAALVLKGETRHELACSACGAPLHDLKMLRTDRGAGTTGPRDLAGPPRYKPAKKKKAKRRKGLMARVLEEAVDLVEDIFD